MGVGKGAGICFAALHLAYNGSFRFKLSLQLAVQEILHVRGACIDNLPTPTPVTMTADLTGSPFLMPLSAPASAQPASSPSASPAAPCL